MCRRCLCNDQTACGPSNPARCPTTSARWGVYAPHSKTFAVQAVDEQRVTAVKLIDVGTAREKLSIPISEKDTRRIGYMAFSPDGTLLVGQLRDEERTGQHWLKFWELGGREVASLGGEKWNYFIYMAFSPDGRTLAVTNCRAGAKLFLFDLPGRKLKKTVPLAGGEGWRVPQAAAAGCCSGT
jgi:hypothetical protein